MYASETEKKVIDIIDKATMELSDMTSKLEGIEDRLDDYTRLFDYDGEISDLDGYDELKYADDVDLKNCMLQLIDIHNRLEAVIKEYEDKIEEIF